VEQRREWGGCRRHPHMLTKSDNARRIQKNSWSPCDDGQYWSWRPPGLHRQRVPWFTVGRRKFEESGTKAFMEKHHSGLRCHLWNRQCCKIVVM
jgi:hypothetical protein